jgi:uncharacterized protein YaaQ
MRLTPADVGDSMQPDFSATHGTHFVAFPEAHAISEPGGDMLLLLAIVQSEDAPDLAKKLLEKGLRLTQINSTGGLFGAGSVALLLGIEEESYPTVLDAIVTTCKTRTKHISAVATPEPTFFFFTPMEVEVGGAVVFGVPVERCVHLPDPTLMVARRGAETEVKEERMETESTPQAQPPLQGAGTRGNGHMKLVVAIVQGEDADEVIRAMLSAGHRLTRINTTGGFLRRGNATLLVGVEEDQIDEVIGIIQSTTRRRTESSPIEKGIPEFAATVFVLDASHFIRV